MLNLQCRSCAIAQALHIVPNKYQAMQKTTEDIITEYYVANLNELRLYANKILDDLEDAKDVVQECFVRMLGMKQSIIPLTLPAMAHSMVRNKAISIVRRKAVARQYNKTVTAVAERQAEHTELRLVMADMVNVAESKIASLPPAYRQIYEMNLYDGMQVKEISETLGLKYKYVDKKLGKARTLVRKGLRNVV